MSPRRWRVDCRRQRGAWRTLLTEAYATQAEAQAARIFHLLTEEWDTVFVVPITHEEGEGRRGLAAGVRVRDGGPRHD